MACKVKSCTDADGLYGEILLSENWAFADV